MIRYPSSNEFGIPDLLPQAHSVAPPGFPMPLVQWGSVSRQRTNKGTFAFYVDDYRFSRLWADPGMVTRTNCQAAIEPNYSVHPDDPKAVALWGIYRKRWIARTWQEANLEIWVDLYVGHGHEDVALLGVPRGWQRYATCASARHLDDLAGNLETAVRHSAGEPFSLVVYGGGAEARDWCSNHMNVFHVPNRTAGTERPGQGTRRARERASVLQPPSVSLSPSQNTGGSDGR